MNPLRQLFDVIAALVQQPEETLWLDKMQFTGDGRPALAALACCSRFAMRGAGLSVCQFDGRRPHVDYDSTIDRFGSRVLAAAQSRCEDQRSAARLRQSQSVFQF